MVLLFCVCLMCVLSVWEEDPLGPRTARCDRHRCTFSCLPKNGAQNGVSMSTLLWGRKRNGWWEMSSLYNIRNKHAHWRTIRFLLHHYKFSLAGEAIAYYSAYLLEKIAACCLDKRKCTAAQLWYHKLDFPEIWNISGSAQINRPAS